MYKTKIFLISNFFVLLVSAQPKTDTTSIVDRMVDTELLSRIFNNDLVSVLNYVENNSELTLDHDQGVIKNTWRLYLYGDAWNMQIVVYSPDNKLEELEFSRLFIEFRTTHEAKKFLSYFAPLAGFGGPADDGRYYRYMQTAEIYEDNRNVVFFWLTYPPVEVDTDRVIEELAK